MERSQNKRKIHKMDFCVRIGLLLVLLAACVLLAGCRKQETPLQEGETEYQIYYMNQSVTKLIPHSYRTKTTDTEGLVGELMESMLHVPADLEAQAVLSDKVVYQGCRRDDNVLYLFFDNNYTSMNYAGQHWPGH